MGRNVLERTDKKDDISSMADGRDVYNLSPAPPILIQDTTTFTDY
jgi:hypothetical protein